MKLFDETESKYFELLSYIANNEDGVTEDSIKSSMMDLGEGELDYPVFETLISKEEGEGAIFSFDGSKFRYVLENGFPVRLNRIEQEALFSIIDLPYVDGFADAGAIEKIKGLLNEGTEVSIHDVKVKNQNIHDKPEDLTDKLKVVLYALKCSGRLTFDNVVEGKFEFKKSCVWPVKLEYSFVNDMFRVCAFLPDNKRFIKFRLDTIKNVSFDDTPREDLEAEYKQFMKENSKKVVLEVDPVQHVIERCFRLFSFYDRKAIYDNEKEKYRLELSYYKFDESEVLRDIMSLGSSAIVVEPRGLQLKIYNRIVAARNRYSV